MPDTRQLSDLRSIGPAMLADFQLLKIKSVSALARQNPTNLYHKLCKLTHSRQDPCVLDTFTCAIAQAKNPHLPKQKCNWFYWSKIRKAAAK